MIKENFEQDTESISSIENEKKINEEIELKEYTIISKYFKENLDNNDEEDNDTKDIYLPTPESFKKLCNEKLIKDVIKFNYEKYKSYFKQNNEDYSSEEKLILNLDYITSIKDANILPYILFFLGGINSINSIYDFFDDSVLMPPEESYVDNNFSYLNYLISIIDYLKSQAEIENIFFNFNYFNLFLNSLEELGICIPRDNKNILYSHMKDKIFSIEKNKNLILIAPSNNFWIKSDKNLIGKKEYDRKLNNYTNIFYNSEFIKKFFSEIYTHPRCKIGLISSMIHKNLISCWQGLKIICLQKEDVDPIFIDQDSHEHIPIDKSKQTRDKQFLRSMKKIILNLKKNNYNNFNEKNIIILESDMDKIGSDTGSNSINVNLFDEKFFESNKEQKLKIAKKEEEVIEYIKSILENCTDDIRSYINQKKLKMN